MTTIDARDARSRDRIVGDGDHLDGGAVVSDRVTSLPPGKLFWGHVGEQHWFATTHKPHPRRIPHHLLTKRRRVTKRYSLNTQITTNPARAPMAGPMAHQKISAATGDPPEQLLGRLEPSDDEHRVEDVLPWPDEDDLLGACERVAELRVIAAASAAGPRGEEDEQLTRVDVLDVLVRVRPTTGRVSGQDLMAEALVLV